VALYLPTLGYGFIYEDLNDVGLSFQEPNLTQAWAAAVERPARSLTGLSFALNQWLVGAMNPAGFHAGNVLLHLLNGWLVYLVSRRVLSATGAAFALGVFWLHPVQVEAVAYVSARADLVSACCVLLALLCTARGWGVAAMVACALAVGGKESAVVAWALVPLWAFWIGQTWPVWMRIAWASSVVVPVMGLLYVHPIALDMTYTLTQLAALWRFFAWMVVPVGLAFDPDWRWITPGVTILSAGAWGAVLTCAWLSRRSAWAFAVVFVVIAVSPRLLVPVLEGPHLHHFYLPMFAISLWAGSLLSERTTE